MATCPGANNGQGGARAAGSTSSPDGSNRGGRAAPSGACGERSERIGRWIRLAEMLSELGDTGRERDAWLGALAAGESLAARARLVDLFLAEGNTGDAIPHMRALAESDSDQAEHWTRLAVFTGRSVTRPERRKLGFDYSRLLMTKTRASGWQSSFRPLVGRQKPSRTTVRSREWLRTSRDGGSSSHAI